MSKRPHSDTSDAIAKARAAIAAKYAKLSTEHKSPKSGVDAASSSSSQGAVDLRPSVPPPPPPAAKSVIDPSFQQNIDAAIARAAATAKSSSQREEPRERTFDSRGGLEVGLHPALQSDSVSGARQSTQRSKLTNAFGKHKANSSKVVAKGKQLQLLSGPDEGFTDKDKNPYFDHKLGGRDTSRPVERRSKTLTFSEPGKYIQKANQIREEENLKALQARIALSARRAGLEDDLEVSGRAIAREEPPDIEWWDVPYTTSGSYADIDSNALKIKSHDSPITAMIQHPIKILAPSDLMNIEPAALKYTKKEQKKIRKQEREANLKDKQDKQRLGLLAADPPKVKLSNLPTVLAHSSIQDPTKVEREVRAQVQARKDQHEQMNEERKLTHEQKQAKLAQALAEDEAKGIRAVAWRIETLANGYIRKKIDDNAQQCKLTGVVILNPRFNLVYAEGGSKSLKSFRRLMEGRIDWTEPPRNPVKDDKEHAELPDYESNKCTEVWEGELKKRSFGAFRYKKCDFESDVKEALRTEVYHLWNIAKTVKEE